MTGAGDFHPISLGGKPCLSGTCAAIEVLFDPLLRGRSIDCFVAQFPTATRSHAEAAIDESSKDVGSIERWMG